MSRETEPINYEESGVSMYAGKAVVIGIYGIPGSGKSFLLNQLKQQLGERLFAFFEGSEVINSVIPTGLSAFHNLEERAKMHYRHRAIQKIAEVCVSTRRVGVVTGHFMFWEESHLFGREVYTRSDLDIYTHIIYLDVPAEMIAERRQADTQRQRPAASVQHLKKWRQAEKAELVRLCHKHSILFLPIASVNKTRLSMLLHNFRYYTKERNLAAIQKTLDEILEDWPGKPETVLVMDADKTLAAEDTGKLFWKMTVKSQYASLEGQTCPLTTLFSSPLGYTDTAFRQAALLYEDIEDGNEYDTICEKAASAATIYPEFVSFLKLVAQQKHVKAVVVTCGLRRVWHKIIERSGLSESVKVIGGGRIGDGFVVTADVKTAIVANLRDAHKLRVWAFGDSVLDLGMLSKAHQAFVVVGEEHTRSKSMDEALLKAINKEGLRARQILLPSTVSPRLDTTKLPLAQLAEKTFLERAFSRRRAPLLLHSTDKNAAKLLMTPTRDARSAGPALRDAHRRVGNYLAMEFLADVLGVQEYSIPHVQGHDTIGHRLDNERKTLIVPLMRGGEAMAFGINDAFPLAMFLHAKNPEDIKDHHVRDQKTVLLVDSVVNSGKSVVEFMERIRILHSTVRVIIVAGVVQAESVFRGSVAELLAFDAHIGLVALRISNNQFTGKGSTDTGNRLFNSTHID